MPSIFEQKKLTFSEFRKPSFEDWVEKIRADLKGEDYTEKFNRQTREGISHLPFYPDSEPPVPAGNLSGSADWEISQYISAPDIEEANKHALSALINGASALYFDLPSGSVSSAEDLKTLLNGIITEFITIRFSQRLSLPMHLQAARQYIKEQQLTADKYRFLFCADPFTAALKTGVLNPSADAGQTGEFKTLSVNAGFYTDAGASMTSQLAFAAASGNEYLGLHKNPEPAAQSIHFNFGINTDYFLETAKLRAFRVIWNKILERYKPGLSTKFPAQIHVLSSALSASVKDPHNNILRAATGAMSAVLGGADAVTLLPFDYLYEPENSFSDRITRNIHHLLKEESYLDKVADPAAGSYYIEHLTRSLAEEAWQEFQNIEQHGGMTACIKSGYIQDKIKSTQKARLEDAKEGRTALLGVNRHPQKEEEQRAVLPEPELPAEPAESHTAVETVAKIRLAETFESEDKQ